MLQHGNVGRVLGPISGFRRLTQHQGPRLDAACRWGAALPPIYPAGKLDTMPSSSPTAGFAGGVVHILEHRDVNASRSSAALVKVTSHAPEKGSAKMRTDAPARRTPLTHACRIGVGADEQASVAVACPPRTQLGPHRAHHCQMRREQIFKASPSAGCQEGTRELIDVRASLPQASRLFAEHLAVEQAAAAGAQTLNAHPARTSFGWHRKRPSRRNRGYCPARVSPCLGGRGPPTQACIAATLAEGRQCDVLSPSGQPMHHAEMQSGRWRLRRRQRWRA